MTQSRHLSSRPITLVVGINAGVRIMQSTNARLSLLSTIELAFELSDHGTPLHKVNLQASDIDLLIARLAHFRATMTPEVPRILSDLKDIGTTVNPTWVLHAPASTNDKLFLVRHPGLGWLMFQLPPSEATKLGHGLLADGSHKKAAQWPPNRPLH
jgi:hypothetical protein